MFEIVLSGFPIPVQVEHQSRLMPDGRSIPLFGRHEWPGPWNTWWFEDTVGSAGEPWPSGRYIDTLLVNGQRHDVAFTVETPPGATLAAPDVTAIVTRSGENDLVTFKVVGFPLLTEVLYKELLGPDGRTYSVEQTYTTTGFAYYVRNAFTASWVRGTYRHRFVIEGKTYEAAATLP